MARIRNSPKDIEWRRRSYLKRKERYHSDPEFRAKVLAKNYAWTAANKKQVAEIQGRKRERKRVFVDGLKTARGGCMHCGETDIRCLDFHHRDPESKVYSLADMAARSWNNARLAAEAAKCDVICANCHRKLHNGHRAHRYAC